jgi:hypothetical protein
MNTFNNEQLIVIDMLRSMSAALLVLPNHNIMKVKITECYEDLRESFANRVARELLNDRLMFKKDI